MGRDLKLMVATSTLSPSPLSVCSPSLPTPISAPESNPLDREDRERRVVALKTKPKTLQNKWFVIWYEQYLNWLPTTQSIIFNLCYCNRRLTWWLLSMSLRSDNFAFSLPYMWYLLHKCFAHANSLPSPFFSPPPPLTVFHCVMQSIPFSPSFPILFVSMCLLASSLLSLALLCRFLFKWSLSHWVTLIPLIHPVHLHHPRHSRFLLPIPSCLYNVGFAHVIMIPFLVLLRLDFLLWNGRCESCCQIVISRNIFV